jgi:hypothetical protein
MDIQRQVGLYQGSAEQEGCYLVFVFDSPRAVDVHRLGDCYFGASAAPEGRYIKPRGKK